MTSPMTRNWEIPRLQGLDLVSGRWRIWTVTNWGDVRERGQEGLPGLLGVMIECRKARLIRKRFSGSALKSQIHGNRDLKTKTMKKNSLVDT
jgi:hypothetical protein